MILCRVPLCLAPLFVYPFLSEVFMSFSLKSLVAKAPGDGQFLKKVADSLPSGKKFELVDDDTVVVDGVTLYRVRAVREFGGTRRGLAACW